MLLVGVDHIKIAPRLLQEIAGTKVETSNAFKLPSLFDEVETGAGQIPPQLWYADDEGLSNGHDEGCEWCP